MSLAAWVAIPASGHRRLRSMAGTSARARAVPIPLADLASICLGLGVAVLLASTWGVALGLVVAVLARRFTSRLESGASRERRRQLECQLPEVCDLLSATIASGAAVHSALCAVADATANPAADELRRVVAALSLGATPATAWRDAVIAPEFQRVQAAFERSAASGAPIAEVLKALSRDERRRRKSAVEVAARSAGVRAIAPLAACFLPAFILLGIVPVVASMAIEVFTP